MCSIFLFPFLALLIVWVDFYVENCIYNILFFWLTRTIHFSLKATPNTHASILTHSHTHISQLTHSSINPEVIFRKSYNLLWIFSVEAKDIPDYICSRSAVRGENQHLSSSSCSVAWPSLVWAIHNLIKCMESLAMKHKALWKGHILPLHLTGSIQTFSFCRERQSDLSLSLSFVIAHAHGAIFWNLLLGAAAGGQLV